ncbi:MAG: GGDEF domain-containing phosphodiesterase [Paracoccaceae bacterium]|nr:GGDEF domain-containing phosphodiesterase [Paracoccaceae bacterium]
MTAEFTARLRGYRTMVQHALTGPQSLAFFPALSLAAYWLGGEPALIAAALGLPMVFVMSGAFSTSAPVAQDEITVDVLDSSGAADLTEQALLRARAANLATACFVLEVEGLETLERSMGREAAESLRELCVARLRNTLRKGDLAVRMSDTRFLVLLGPSLRLDLEALLQLSSRLQSALEEPATIANTAQYLSASIGFCGSDRLGNAATGEKMLEAAQTALTEAVANGPSAVRAWSDDLSQARKARKSLMNEVEKAMANGQVQPWYQPQVCTSTGRISGVEALARWIHPERGIIPPAQFLKALEEAGQMERLSEVILQHSLTALRTWDNSGIDVPRISVNFSGIELKNPQLVERIKWELDRFGLTAPRLGIEVLETVIADSPEGVVARNITELSDLGCQIDLDDFGTGHASITALRRFTVHRLKIDRSFVSRVDRDEEQRRMLAAVLGMADRLGLETLAEGVETVGEHALLAQLGCDHVQGFGIARPMPADQLIDWAKAHAVRIADAQRLGRGAG